MEDPLEAARAKHTPGPWTEEESAINAIDIWAGDQRVIACVMSEVATDGNDELAADDWANARLIAAAPDLLAALRLFLAEYVQLVESGDAGFWDAEKEEKVIAARAAISKAEGATHD